jgi:WD40 repeat protein
MVRFPLIVLALGIPALCRDSAGDELYRAAIAAASSALQLNDTAGAQAWLDRAPEKQRGWEWRYLNSRARQAEHSFPAMEGAVAAVAVSPDGGLVAAAGVGHIVVHDAVGRKIRWEHAANARVNSLAFSPDSRQLAASLEDRTVRLWEVPSGKEVWRAEQPGGAVAALAWHPTSPLIAAASAALPSQPDVNRAGMLTLLDAASGEARRRIPFLRGAATTVSWSTDGARVAAGNEFGALAVWDAAMLDKPPLLMTPEIAGGPAAALASAVLLPDARRILAGYADGRLLLWDTQDPLKPRALRKLDRAVAAVAVHPRGEWLAALSGDGTVQVLSGGAAGPGETLQHAVAAGRCAAVSSDGRRLYTGHADGTLVEWGETALETGRRTWSHPPEALGFEWSPDGKRAASAARGGALKLWDAATGHMVWEQYAHQFAANAVLFSFDQERLYSAGADGRVQGMDLKSATLVMTFEHAPDARGWTMALSPDGLRFVTGSTRPSAKVFDVMTGATRLTIEGNGDRQSGEVWGVDWSLDGSLIALGWTGGGAALVDAATGAMKVELRGHEAAVRGVAFAPDGKTLATASDDGKIRIFSTADGSLIRTLSGHGAAVFGLDFSPDGARLASASADHTVRIWDPASGHALVRLPTGASTRRVRFSPDGARLAVLPADGRILILNGPPS